MIRSVPFYLILLCLLTLSSLGIAQSQIKPSEKEISSKAFYEELKGDWKGSYSLWLRPGTPAQVSDINANFQSVAKGNYFLMTYSWKKGNEAQEGVFLFGGNKKTATATWGDSFHSVPEPMQCKGELMDDGKTLIFEGSYSMGEDSAWGWQTEFTQQSQESLLMEAYNIMPNGVEVLAVKAELKRVER